MVPWPQHFLDVDLIKSIKFSNAAAALSVTRLGAQDSIPKIKN